MICKTQIKII